MKCIIISDAWNGVISMCLVISNEAGRMGFCRETNYMMEIFGIIIKTVKMDNTLKIFLTLKSILVGISPSYQVYILINLIM